MKQRFELVFSEEEMASLEYMMKLDGSTNKTAFIKSKIFDNTSAILKKLEIMEKCMLEIFKKSYNTNEILEEMFLQDKTNLPLLEDIKAESEERINLLKSSNQ